MKNPVSKNTSVVIGKEHGRFIKAQIRKGRFGSASEAVRAGLALLEEQELKVERLRQALAEGEASGQALPFDVEDYIAAKRAGAK
jgi:antitoxin ParD1/3/4